MSTQAQADLVNALINALRENVDQGRLTGMNVTETAIIVALIDGQQELIRCQQIVLDQIAAVLGVEIGDVDGIGAAIEGLKQDAERYRNIYQHLMRSNIEAGESYLALRVVGCPPSEPEFYDALDKALAAGEAV